MISTPDPSQAPKRKYNTIQFLMIIHHFWLSNTMAPNLKYYFFTPEVNPETTLGRLKFL